MKTVTILGSTGSVGRQTLAAVDKHPEAFRVVGLSAFSNEELLRGQIEKYNPTHYYFPGGAVEIQPSIFDYMEDGASSKCLTSLEELAGAEADIVVSAVGGIAGLWAAVAVLKRGGVLAIANKETLVCAGRHLKALEKKHGGLILPLDTEHSAIAQCLLGEKKKHVASVTVTASGGALRDIPIDRLNSVTPDEALRHPVWKMGRKVTIDSATLFNKGLEVIEAMRLFELGPDKVKVLMHRESIVHGLVEFCDGGQKALLSTPSMSLAIETALFYPKRASDSVAPMDLADIGTLHFAAPDLSRYPCLELALAAARDGEGAQIALSSADEVLVEAFLAGKIGFGEIPAALEKTLNRFGGIERVDLEDIIGIDAEARKYIYSIGVK